MKKFKQTSIKSLADIGALPTSEPSREEIAALAHSIWEQAGRPEGRDMEHWLQAETQIRQQRGSIRV